MLPEPVFHNQFVPDESWHCHPGINLCHHLKKQKTQQNTTTNPYLLHQSNLMLLGESKARALSFTSSQIRFQNF